MSDLPQKKKSLYSYRHKRSPVLSVFLGYSFLLAVVCPGLKAQYFSWGEDPASLKWKQLRTENFRLIYPEDFQENALYLIDLLEYIYEPASRSLGHRPRQSPVILHNHTVVPNGFVSWAPFRMEMFTTPPPGNGTHDWLERLAIHEFRHVVQTGKMNQGLIRWLSYVLGQQATGVAIGLFLPPWLLEGDAVVAETALTSGGRGREASFEQGLRAQVLQKGRYSFDKALFGSYRDHVPNYYELGYQLVAWTRVHHGADIWEKLIDRAARRPWTILPMTFGLREYTGLNRQGLYHASFDSLEISWRHQYDAEVYTKADTLTRERKVFTNYTQPAVLDDGRIMALRTAMDDIPKVVALGSDGPEEILFFPGNFNARAFSSNGRQIVWSETRRDIRWEHRSWSEIHIYDILSGKKERLTQRSRFFSPAVSPCGNYIAAIEIGLANECSVVLLSSDDADILKRFGAPAHGFFMTPSWSADGKSIVLVLLTETGKDLLELNLDEGRFDVVFQAGHIEISRPVYLSGGDLAFVKNHGGREEIFLLEKGNPEPRRIIIPEFGAADPAYDREKNQLVWADYTAMGYRIRRSSYNPDEALPATSANDYSPAWYRQLADQEDFSLKRSDVPRQNHLPQNYSKLLNLFHLHSWGPLVIDRQDMSVQPGFSLVSQNLLSTAVASAGYAWDVNEQLGRWHAGFQYSGWYPLISLRAETGMRRLPYRISESDETAELLFREQVLRAGLGLPLRGQKGQWFWGLTPFVRTSRTRVISVAETPSFFRENTQSGLEYQLFAYRQLRMSARDLRPRFAQLAELHFRHSPFGGDMGRIMAFGAAGFFPGLAPHHSLRISLAYQERVLPQRLSNTVQYQFPNLVSYPRGLETRYDERMQKLSLDYAFPLAYPEWSLPSVIYLKRLHANLFADYARARNMVSDTGKGIQTQTWYSSGLDLVAQMHLLRFFSPFDIGVRGIYQHQQANWSIRLLMVAPLI